MLNKEYWNNEGVQKVYTHPICPEWVAGLDRKSVILDLGCGYGRLTPDLRRGGFSNIFGYDASGPLIERALCENPGATYTCRLSDLADKSFDLILCFALFTSCPAADEQDELAGLIDKLSKKNGRLYISDYETGDNPDYCHRYEQKMLNIYGCFESGNAIFRHHEPGHFDRLLTDWKRLKDTTIGSKTLNGNDVRVHQYLYMKSSL